MWGVAAPKFCNRRGRRATRGHPDGKLRPQGPSTHAAEPPPGLLPGQPQGRCPRKARSPGLRLFLLIGRWHHFPRSRQADQRRPSEAGPFPAAWPSHSVTSHLCPEHRWGLLSSAGGPQGQAKALASQEQRRGQAQGQIRQERGSRGRRKDGDGDGGCEEGGGGEEQGMGERGASGLGWPAETLASFCCRPGGWGRQQAEDRRQQRGGS